MSYVSPGRTVTKVTPIDVGGAIGERKDITAHSQDDAMSVALGSLTYSVVYMAVFAIVLLAGVGLVWWMAPKVDLFLVVLVALLAWGCLSYGILGYNREQGLHHSPTGIVHHEIDSRQEIALHAMDLHAYLLERQWEREDGLPANRNLLEYREPPAA
jgi:hypothetical protein